VLKGYGEEAKTAVRADLRGSGIKGAAKLAGAWRGKMFPANAGKHADKPAYVIGSSAEKIVSTFEDGPTIQFANRGGLVPIGKARRLKLRPGQARTELPQVAMAFYGVNKLSWGRLRTGELALGVYSALETGKQKFIPLFLVRASVQAPKLLKGRAIIEKKSREAAMQAPDRTFALFEQKRDRAGDNKSGGYRPTVQAG
jgi:hypothetical protein